MQRSFTELPSDLPVPIDDGACAHLLDMTLPLLSLSSTSGYNVSPGQLTGWVVIYCYPMTGQPGRALPSGWLQIPGATGCTPQSCSFRDRHETFQRLNVRVFGTSVQTTEYQAEAVERLGLPFELLSDVSFEFTEALRLPTFEVDGMRLLKRVTLIANNGKIAKYFYPMFPPDRHVNDVVDWLERKET